MRNGMIARRKLGMTLIELLVVIGIVGLLATLIIPAVQSSREAARRAECLNHTKQIMLGVANFEATNRFLPSMCTADERFYKVFGRFANGHLSLHYRILPYIDQKPMFDSINFRAGEFLTSNGYRSIQNRTALNTRLDIFLCPSDRRDVSPGNNYRANLGPHPNWFKTSTTPGAGGPFEYMNDATLSKITDGLSNTAGIGERSKGNGDVSRYDRSRDFWVAGFNPSNELTVTAEQLFENCRLAPVSPLHFHSEFGRHWLNAWRTDTVYDHVFPPNSKIPDCSSDLFSFDPSTFNQAAVSARSNHPGGVHVGFMDGSVRFVKDTVSLPVWRAIATRAGEDNADGL